MCRGAPTNLAMCHTHRPQNFRAPRILYYTFWDICKSFQPSHLKNHEFYFFTKQPTKPSSYVVVHRPTWPCAKPTDLKTFVQQEFYGIHLGTFVDHFNVHISKTTNFIFSQTQPTRPSSYVVVHRPTWPCAKPTELKTFEHQELYGIHLGRIVDHSNLHISETTNFIFSQNNPPSHLCRGAPTNLAICKPHRT